MNILNLKSIKYHLEQLEIDDMIDKFKMIEIRLKYSEQEYIDRNKKNRK